MDEQIKNKVREIQHKYCGEPIETKLYYAIKETMDDNDIIYGDDANRFVENMIKAETEPPTKKQKELMEEIKRNAEARYFDTSSSKPIAKETNR